MTDADPSAGSSELLAESVYIPASDDLRLHVKAYRPRLTKGLPVICLPGLARTEADFEALARHLASLPACPRDVFALDYRGRGRSSYDPDWRNYNLAVELADVVTVLMSCDVRRAIFVGTSRGGLVTMLLAAAQPSFIAGAVLNDIGPVIEPKGLQRIKSYIGKMPSPKDYAEGAEVLRRLFGGQFPALSEEEWFAWSTRSWAETPHGLIGRYDVNLGNTLNDTEPDQPIPTLWEQFDALARMPIMVIRGALSDLLSSETVAAMRQRRPDLEVLVVPHQGHAPLLAEAPVLRQIGDFCQRCDAATP